MRALIRPLILCTIALSLTQISCDNRQQGEASKAIVSEKRPRITFAQKDLYDFGTMKEGAVVEHNFEFTNTGEFPLIINNITASCGCTTPEWPREPIQPGGKSSVRVRFNSRGKMGEQSKTITIFANTDPTMTDLQFRAMVVAAADTSKTS